MRYLFGAVVASAITIFALQNTTPTSLRFLFWSLPQTPLAAVILASVAAGIVLVGLPFWITRWRLRRNFARSRRVWRTPRRARRSASRHQGRPGPPGGARIHRSPSDPGFEIDPQCEAKRARRLGVSLARTLHQLAVVGEPALIVTSTGVGEICRKLGVSEQSFYRWKKRFGALGVSELRELRQLREENRKLKGLVADLSLDKTILHEALRRKW